MAGTAANSVVNTWTFHDTHVDENITDVDFLSAARCILYARKSSLATTSGSEFQRIGVIQGYNWSEQKQLELIFEIGSDIPYIVPGRTTGQIAISRILLSGTDFTNLIYNTNASNDTQITDDTFIRSLRDVSEPMDMLFAYYAQNVNTKQYSDVYTRLFSTCWLQARNESIAAGQILVAENVNIMYQNVTKASFSNIAAAGN